MKETREIQRKGEREMEGGKERGRREGGRSKRLLPERGFICAKHIKRAHMPLLEIPFKSSSYWETEMLCNRSK